MVEGNLALIGGRGGRQCIGGWLCTRGKAKGSGGCGAKKAASGNCAHDILQ